MSGRRQGKLHQADTNDASRKEADGGGPAKAGKKKERGARPAEVGRALRSVYDDTLRETVPNDFLDLLGKLS